MRPPFLVIVLATAMSALTASGSAGATGTSPALHPAVAASFHGPAVAAGGFSTFELRADGTVWGFGDNSAGQLGFAANSNPNPFPTRVPSLTNVTAIAAGGAHTVVLRSDGTVWAFGSNLNGQLGIATTVGSSTPNAAPVQVPGLADVTAIAAGRAHTVALRSDGTVWAFGDNTSGQLGTSDPQERPTPRPVPGLTDVTAIAAGADHTVALRSDGTVWVVGASDPPGGAVARPVPGLTNVTAIAASRDYTVVLRSDGTVWGFGINFYGQLGTATKVGTNDPIPPTQVAGLDHVAAIAAGGDDTVVLRSDGTVWGFGRNLWGALGPVTGIFDAPHPTPMQVPGLTGVTVIAAGYLHTAVLRSDGTVWALGYNDRGEVGSIPDDSGISAIDTPTRVPPTARFVPMVPERVLDTRPGSAVNYPGDKPVPSSSVKVAVIDVSGVPRDATAITANLTVTDATAPGYVQAFPTGIGTVGTSSNLNVDHAGQTIANAITVPLGLDRTITLYTQAGGHLLLDVTGYYRPAVVATAGRLVPVTPARILDTRPASRENYTGTTPAAGSTTRVQVTGTGPVPTDGVAAVVLNVTATDTAGPGYVQVAPAGALVPGASSNLNVERAGQTIANQVIAAVDASGAIAIHTSGGGHLVVDVTAYITDERAPAGDDGLFVAMAPTRVLDTRPGSRVGYVGALPAPGATVTIDTTTTGVIPSGGVGAVAANVAITEATAAGFVQAAPAGSLTPGASSVLNASGPGQTVANASVIPLAKGRFDLYTQSGGHLLTDVFGWYTAAPA